MTVRRQIGLLVALAALCLGAGCGGRDALPTVAEMDERLYREGEQYKRQGRSQEALASFLKVIEKRGEQSSAESHLEAGLIFLNHSKDPIFAYYHFRQYLAQQPNSPRAAGVRDLINTAKLEIWRTMSMPGQSQDNQASLKLREQVETLGRENELLRGEIAALRGSANAPILRTTRTPVNGETPLIGPILPAPTPVIPVEEASLITAVPVQAATDGPTQAERKTAPAPARVPPARPTGTPAPAPARRHTVVPQDSLFGLSKKYYGVGSMAKAEAIYEANRDVMKHKGDLKPGMELKIP